MFGIGKTATGVANAAVAIPIRNIDSQIERAIQRETSTRKRIQAEVDKIKIKEKYKTARAKTYNELGYRYINESDQIMTAYDNHFLEAHIKLKKGGRAHLRLSPLNMTYLMAMVIPAFGDNPVSLPQLAQQNRLTLYNLIDKMEFMARTAQSQGDLSFTLPPGWGESENEYDPPTPPPNEPDEPDPWKNTGQTPPRVGDTDPLTGEPYVQITPSGEGTSIGPALREGFWQDQLQKYFKLLSEKSSEYARKESLKSGPDKDLMAYRAYVKSGEKKRYEADIAHIEQYLKKIRKELDLVVSQTR